MSNATAMTFQSVAVHLLEKKQHFAIQLGVQNSQSSASGTRRDPSPK
jgi:hypothetical protein